MPRRGTRVLAACVSGRVCSKQEHEHEHEHELKPNRVWSHAVYNFSRQRRSKLVGAAFEARAQEFLQRQAFAVGARAMCRAAAAKSIWSCASAMAHWSSSKSGRALSTI